jgi:phage-related protein
VTIYGAATNPFIRNATTDQSIELTIALAGSDVLVLDFADRTITLNGTATRYSALDTGSIWWELVRGENTIQYGGGGRIEVAFRSAWRAA